MIWQIITSLSTTLLALFALSGIIQLNIIRNNNYLDKIRILIEIEKQIYNYHYKIFEINNELKVIHQITRGNPNKIPKSKIKELKSNYYTYLELYLNVVDRLCYLIMSGRMKSINWKSEYGKLINQTYNEFSTEIENKYNNIQKVYLLFTNTSSEKFSLDIKVKNKYFFRIKF